MTMFPEFCDSNFIAASQMENWAKYFGNVTSLTIQLP